MKKPITIYLLCALLLLVSSVQIVSAEGGYELLHQWSGPYYTNQYLYYYYAPYDIALDSSGNVYGATFNDEHIIKTDSCGDIISIWELNESCNNGLHIDRQDNVYVGLRGSISKYSSSGGFIQSVSIPEGFYEFTVDDQGNIYTLYDVPGNAGHAVKRSSNGQVIAEWGWGLIATEPDSSCEPLPGICGYPSGIQVDNQGNVYVHDSWNYNRCGKSYERLLKFSPAGIFTNTPSAIWIGRAGSADEQLGLANNIKFDTTGNIYAPNWYERRINKFDTSGNLVASWPINSDGYPDGIAVADNGNVYVAMWFGSGDHDRVWVYTPEGSSNSLFQTTKASGPFPFTVQFTDASTGDPTGWQWDFNNDGIIDSTDQNPSFTYINPGIYSVNLTITGPNGVSSTTRTNYIQVSGIRLLVEPNSTARGDEVNITVRGSGFTADGAVFPPGARLPPRTGFPLYAGFHLVNDTFKITIIPHLILKQTDTEITESFWTDGNIKEGLYDVAVYGNGGTIARLEKGFNIRPIEFQPNPDGYQFENPGGTKVPWEIFTNSYENEGGFEYASGIPKIRPLYFYLHNIRDASDGICFGMSATSLIIWQKQISWQKTWTLGTKDAALPKSWGIFSAYPFLTTVTDWIQFYHIRRTGDALIQENKNYENNPDSIRIVYNKLKEKLADSKLNLDNPYELSYTFGKDGAHSVVPIRIEEDPSTSTAKIIVYDSRNPGEEKYFSYDTIAGTATSPQDGQIACMGLHPLDMIETKQEIPDLGWADRLINLFITDSEGRVQNDLGLIFSDGSGDHPQVYYLGDQELKAEIIGNGTGVGSVSIMRPNGVAVINVSVNPSSTGEVRVPQSGSSVEYISTSGTDSLDLTLSMDGADEGRIATVDGFDVDPSKAVNLSFGANRDDVSVLNTGSSATVHFSLEQVGAAPGAFASSRPLRVEAASSVRIVPSDWTDLDDAPIRVEHDLGSDGVVEYTETVGSDVHLLPLPGCVSPPADLDGDGLCEDVNGNGRPDFADVVLYFNQMSWISGNEPVAAFDFNGNGRIDFADVVWLFNHL